MDSESDMGDPQTPFIRTDSEDECQTGEGELMCFEKNDRENTSDNIDSSCKTSVVESLNTDLEKFIDGMTKELDITYSTVTLRLAKPCYEEARVDNLCPSGCDYTSKKAIKWVKNKYQCKACNVEWTNTREGPVMTKDMQIYSLTLKLNKSLSEIESLKHILKLQQRRDCYLHTKRDMWIEPLD
jgi:hypothetical protein